MANARSEWSKESSEWTGDAVQVCCAVCCEALIPGQQVKDQYVYELDYLDYIELAHATCIDKEVTRG